MCIFCFLRLNKEASFLLILQWKYPPVLCVRIYYHFQCGCWIFKDYWFVLPILGKQNWWGKRNTHVVAGSFSPKLWNTAAENFVATGGRVFSIGSFIPLVIVCYAVNRSGPLSKYSTAPVIMNCKYKITFWMRHQE